jgi:hypothetical protein
MATGLFPNLQAWKVFNAPNFEEIGNCAYWTVDAPGSPVSLAFNSRNQLVIGNDGYYGEPQQRELRQLWFYADPLAKQTPDAWINLFMGTPGEMAFDENDNLLIQDHTWYRVTMINLDCDPEWLSFVQAPVTPTETPVPAAYQLHQAVPNPFHVSTRLVVDQPAKGRLRVGVYSASGRLVRLLVDRTLEAGSHRIDWDGKDDQNRPLPSGVYLCRMEAAGEVHSKKLVIAR